jgi:DNA topoisomerase-1
MKLRISLSKATNWFSELSKEDQDAYLEAHPGSKYGHQTAKPRVSKITQSLSGTTKYNDAGVRVQANGSALPDHITKLTIPPAWTDVKFNPDAAGDLLASGRDAKGRLQCVYSEAFSKTQAEAKFRRIEELMGKFHEVQAQNDKLCRSTDPKVKASAECLKLVMVAGIRPGSETDTGAEKQAYGATTLEARHVVKTKEGVELHFVGKKGVDLKIPVTDPATVKMLLRRAKEAGDDGKLFSQTNDKRLLDHTHTMDGGGFKTKDFRTLLGTSTAMDEVSKMPKPVGDKAYRAQVMSVAKTVSKKLGNTPVIALQSYINPIVFQSWRQ